MTNPSDPHDLASSTLIKNGNIIPVSEYTKSDDKPLFLQSDSETTPLPQSAFETDDPLAEIMIELLRKHGSYRLGTALAQIDAELSGTAVRQTRKVGALTTRALVRKELGILYREAHAALPVAGETVDPRNYTRLAYMLDCLARLTTDTPNAENTGQGDTE